MQDKNNLSIVEITLYSLLGVIVLTIIIALIWTKLIKKNTFSHVSYNYFSAPTGKKMFLKLLKEGTLKKIYTKIIFNIHNISIQSINDIYIGNNYIYLISPSLAGNIGDIKIENGKILTVNKKNNQKLNINPEIELFNSACRDFSKIFKVQNNVKVIIPVSNKEFKTTETQTNIFVSTSNLGKTIKELESEGSTPLFHDELKEIEKSIIVKNRRFFIKLKSVHE